MKHNLKTILDYHDKQFQDFMKRTTEEKERVRRETLVEVYHRLCKMIDSLRKEYGSHALLDGASRCDKCKFIKRVLGEK